ncbi:hypothetical protein Y032_0045g1095 [Ancylostoma ceylanicum]|uniref:Uncharacterized protein n=1 Tax=Ancylostoma ceylanicum TaxID=53326 RepID=A0A016UCA4_9BILA|nr:hypothetical protein Y032_0045g1095 [Ancylostoma ceylanicum]
MQKTENLRLPLYSSRSIAVSVAAVVDNGDRRSRPSPLSSTRRPTVAAVVDTGDRRSSPSPLSSTATTATTHRRRRQR